MQAKAITRGVRISPTKVRPVIDLVRGKPVDRALAILRYMPHKAAREVARTIKSAAANADVMAMLLNAGAKIDARDHRQRTPLHLCALKGRPGAVDGLLDPARRELCDKVGGRDEQEDVQAAQQDRGEQGGDEPDGPRAADRRQGFEDRV